MDPNELANCYLHSALRLLHLVEDLPYADQCRRSALKLQVKSVLGRPLTNALAAIPSANTYRYRWLGFRTDRDSSDHVVPLDEVIDYVRQNLGHFPADNVQQFRAFVAPRAVTARIPDHVNSTLTAVGLRHRMPDGEWKHTVDPDVLWRRYSVLGIPHPAQDPVLWSAY